MFNGWVIKSVRRSFSLCNKSSKLEANDASRHLEKKIVRFYDQGTYHFTFFSCRKYQPPCNFVTTSFHLISFVALYNLFSIADWWSFRKLSVITYPRQFIFIPFFLRKQLENFFHYFYLLKKLSAINWNFSYTKEKKENLY